MGAEAGGLFCSLSLIAYEAAYEGSVTVGKGSCTGGDRSCEYAGYYGNAVIGDKSCAGTYACYDLAYDESESGGVTSQVGKGSCNGYYACYEAGENNDSTIGQGSCNNYEACYQVGVSSEEDIGKKECNEPRECSNET